MGSKFAPIIIFFILFPIHNYGNETIVNDTVKKWSEEIGAKLYDLSMTMSRKKIVQKNFDLLKQTVVKADGQTLIEDVAYKMRVLMAKKVEAVERIADYAELLSYNRDIESIDPYYEGPFQFFNADNITNTTASKEKKRELQEFIRDRDCIWWCAQKDYDLLEYNRFNVARIEKLFEGQNQGKECDCNNLPESNRPSIWFTELPLEYDDNTGEYVNYNLSVARIVRNVYHRDQKVMEGIRWSEPLDLLFKYNRNNDSTLTFQYFASPLGYMRHYPAVKWSEETYDVTYDPRTRSWYTEAMTSPKDVFILVDKSGSMISQNRRKIAQQIINNILDTLNDNDFVNIYAFCNTTDPVVSCFNNTLVQANEENLRLLRESLDVYTDEFVAELTTGLNLAFDILERFREQQLGSRCNQAIFIITDTMDYGNNKHIFEERNWKKGTPVRVFGYILNINPDDAYWMEWTACSNKGYFVNVTAESEVREKVLNYLNVMSRPVNSNYCKESNPIWSYLQIDLADRRYSNWLWKKFERNRRRQVYLDYLKRKTLRENMHFTSLNHVLLNEEEEEIQKSEYTYLTTVSMPVYGRRMNNSLYKNQSRLYNDFDLIGVAGVDVPIKLLHSLVPHYKIGVNGYAFILTNNGYILMHPGHRREFQNIPKPTFNRVDLLEIEILDDNTPPRLFSKEIIQLREKIVTQNKTGYMDFRVKFPLDDMKRVMLSERRYYNTDIGPFNLGIALHKHYGLMVVNHREINNKLWKELYAHLKNKRSCNMSSTADWAVHPYWVYCNDTKGKTPKQRILYCINKCDKSCRNEKLLKAFLFDVNATKWFGDCIENEERYRRDHLVTNVFLATYTGLTRWRNFENKYLYSTEEQVYDDFDDGDNFETNMNFTAIDEDWYIRTVEENYKKRDMFIYSVPFEISGYENNTLITSTHAIFVGDDEKDRFPAAVVGLQFNHRAMYELYQSITTKPINEQCLSKPKAPGCDITCESEQLLCFILDNNAYVILADEVEFTGRFIGDIKPDIMHHLVENEIYIATQMFDYQAICHKLPPKPKEPKKRLFQQKYYESINEDTLAYERLRINKTLPTPCDTQMWLFNFGQPKSQILRTGKKSMFDCEWVYVVHKIPHSNLLFMAINNTCVVDTVKTYLKSPTPKEINYNNNTSEEEDKRALPCYINTHNQFSRKMYMECYNNTSREDKLNENDRYYCGSFDLKDY